MRGKTCTQIDDTHRDFLVRELACYSTPKEAAEALKAEFGIEISPQRAEAYDPNKKAAARLSPKWRAKFAAYRKAFLDDAGSTVPEAHKAVRVRELAKMHRRAKARGNDVLAADMLERIAKETGNVHTNRREHTGRDGKPVQFENVSTMTPEQLNDELRERLKNPALREWVFSLGVPVPSTATAAPGSETKQ